MPARSLRTSVQLPNLKKWFLSSPKVQIELKKWFPVIGKV